MVQAPTAIRQRQGLPCVSTGETALPARSAVSSLKSTREGRLCLSRLQRHFAPHETLLRAIKVQTCVSSCGCDAQYQQRSCTHIKQSTQTEGGRSGLLTKSGASRNYLHHFNEQCTAVFHNSRETGTPEPRHQKLLKAFGGSICIRKPVYSRSCCMKSADGSPCGMGTRGRSSATTSPM